MGKVTICDHPLIQHKLTYIRDETTDTKVFRELVDEVAALMVYEITRDLPLEYKSVKTPVAMANCRIISGRTLGVILILRAALGMADGILKLIPKAKVGHIGLFRDPQTLQPVEYYSKLPVDVELRELIIVDPMLATGGSAIAAIDLLKKRNCTNLKLMCLIAAPEGIEAVRKAHPDIDIYIAAIDDGLNEHGYIVPGLGDAGNRLFGTN
ncbi:MAG TPA: uracil phosphoribosyltransferase [Bacilli bacterium]